MNTIFIVDLESIPTRYTSEWKTEVPKQIQEKIDQVGLPFRVEIVEGDQTSTETSTGAFLGFATTNIYKGTQVAKLGELVASNRVKDGDRFLFTDAWHPGIINLKYMLGLHLIDAEIHALWHAGSYDNWDFLGRTFGDDSWIRSFERSLYHAIDFNWFATDFHIAMFNDTLFGKDMTTMKGYYRTGWPMEYLKSKCVKRPWEEKENIVVFPHRNSIEKHPEMFENIKREFSTYAEKYSNYEFVHCNLPKDEYLDLLSRAKYAVSFAEQETLGISMYEALLSGCKIIVPDRLSYSEMYDAKYRYKVGPYIEDTVKHKLVELIQQEPHDVNEIHRDALFVGSHFFNGVKLYQQLLRIN